MQSLAAKIRRFAPIVRCSALAALIAVGAGGTAPAWAQAEGTSLSFVSEPGDYIGQGQSLTFTPADAGFTAMVSSDQRQVAVSIAPGGSSWTLNLAAPEGQQLVSGAYENATRWPFQSPVAPGLDFSGDGRGCNELTGRFEVLEAVYGQYGYVERFHATFEQHCEGAEPALFGEVRIVNPPPPAPMTVEVTIDPKGAVQHASGVATVGGTIRCSEDTSIDLFGLLLQRASRFEVGSGGFGMSLACTTEASSWTARVLPGDVPFNPGLAEVDVTGSAIDPGYGVPVNVGAKSLVRLTAERR